MNTQLNVTGINLYLDDNGIITRKSHLTQRWQNTESGKYPTNTDDTPVFTNLHPVNGHPFSFQCSYRDGDGKDHNILAEFPRETTTSSGYMFAALLMDHFDVTAKPSETLDNEQHSEPLVVTTLSGDEYRVVVCYNEVKDEIRLFLSRVWQRSTGLKGLRALAGKK